MSRRVVLKAIGAGVLSVAGTSDAAAADADSDTLLYLH